MTIENDLPGILTDMLRSFATLGKTLSLTETTKTLNVTRQTVRRHIAGLEEIKGVPLFSISNGEYRLTMLGEQLLPSAEAILDSSSRFINGTGTDMLSLAHAIFKTDEKGWFYAQRHPLNSIWSTSVPLIKRSLSDWMMAKGQLDSDCFDAIRPYMIVYRQRGAEWICVEIGSESSFATWLGPVVAKSAIGLPLHKDPITSRADRYLIEPYGHVTMSGGIWYDHVCTRFPRKPDNQLYQVNYQRLVFACTFPDGSQAVGTIVARTNNVMIKGVEGDDMPKMLPEELMEFEM